MFRLVWDYIRRHKWSYLLVVVTLIIYDVTLLLPTQIIQRLIDTLSHQALTEAGLVREMLFLFLLAVLSYGTAYIWHLKLFQGSVHFKFDLQQRAFKKLIAMRTPFYEKFRSGDIMTRFSTDVEGMMDLIGYGLMIVVYAGGMVLFIVPTMFVISWQISLMAMLPMVAMSVGIFFLGGWQDRVVEQNREAIATLNTEVLEVVDGIRVIRAYSNRADQERAFQKKTRKLAQKGDEIAALQAAYQPLGTLCLALSMVIVLFLGAGAIRSGQLSLGQVIALQLYILSLVEPFWMLSDFILVYQTGKVSFGKLQELIETGDEMESDGQAQLEEIEEVTLSDYHFTYPQAERQSLLGINWKLKAGQTVGIVGKTGSGKTTLVRQFLRQYPVGKGRFTINGQPLTSFQRSSIERQIGYVPQEHILFSRSVEKNVALGKPDSSREELLQAIETAAFTQDLERMADGLATMIGERGVSISGGQKQRISLARAFLCQPDLLILDDSLSAVDARTEEQIIRNIQEERAGKTTLIVSHRLSAVQHADWILVLDEGRVVEEGTPYDLLEKRGWYFEQYQRQQGQEGGQA